MTTTVATLTAVLVLGSIVLHVVPPALILISRESVFTVTFYLNLCFHALINTINSYPISPSTHQRYSGRFEFNGVWNLGRTVANFGIGVK